MKRFLRSQRVLPLATGVLLVALMAVSLVSWALGRSAPHALADSTWTSQNSGTSNTLLGIACPSVSDCFAVTQASGMIVATTDGGMTWKSQNSGSSGLLAIACPSASACFAVGNRGTNGNGTIVATTDGGMTWTSQNSGVDTQLFGIACPSVSVCFAVGDLTLGHAYGTIVATTDGGMTWTRQNSSSVGNNGLLAIACPSVSDCFAVGGNGAIVATTEGGMTWTRQNSGTSNTLGGIACPSASDCFAVGGFGTIVATTDGGMTWTRQNSGTSDAFAGIACPSASDCFAVGANGTIVATTDGGMTWTGQNSGTSNLLVGIACPSVSDCFAVGANGTILFSGTTTSPDTTPPVLHLPGTITIDATSPQGAVVSYTVTATDPDNLPDKLTINCTPASGSTFPIGTTTVNCQASDPAGNKATGSFQVVVKGAATQTSDLIALVDSSTSQGPAGLQTSFDSQLQTVQADLAANNTTQACSDLTSFINHVNAQSGKKLTKGQADQLLAAATNIRKVLGC